MTITQFLKTMTAGAALAALVVFGLLIVQPSGRAANDNSASEDEKQMIQIGIKVAPVRLNTAGKDPDLVGLGSYLVNVIGDCNGCHTKDPATYFLPTGNPYLLMPPTVHLPASNRSIPRPIWAAVMILESFQVQGERSTLSPAT